MRYRGSLSIWHPKAVFDSLRATLRRPRSLRVLQALLVTATALPMVALLVYSLKQEALAEMEHSRSYVVGLADVAAADTSARLSEYERVAALLAQRPLVRDMNPERCDPLLQEVAGQNKHLANVATVNLDGLSVCTLLRPADGVRRNIGNPSWLQKIRQGSGFVVGQPQKGIYTGRWILVLAYPVLNQRGVLEGAVELVLNLEAFAPLVAAALPQDAVVGIIDKDAYSIARNYKPEDVVGRKMRNTDLGQKVLHGQQGVVESDGGPDGVQRMYAYKPIGTSDWFVVAGVPSNTVRDRVWRNALGFGLLALGVLATSFWLVLTIGRKIDGPMMALSRTAQRVAAGELDVRAPEEGPLEVMAVAGSLNKMLDRIPLIQKDLREIEAQHRSLVEMSPDGIVVHHNDAILYANQGFRQMFRVPEGMVLEQRSLTALVEPAMRQKIRERFLELMKQPSRNQFIEFQMRRFDGQVIDAEKASCSVEMHGQIVIQSEIRDITVRKQAERALEQMNQTLEARIEERTAALEAANRDLEAFSYSVAHDLRAPLRTINGFSSLLQAALPVDLQPRVASHVERIVRSTQDMDRLIQGLLDVAHAGRGVLAFQAVDMRAMVESVVAAQEDLLPAHVSIADLPVLQADPLSIRQVWTNLISNARKYSARRNQPHIEIGCTVGATESVFHVRDNGVGFDPADVGRLFGVFERLHAGSEFEGAGIGLAIVRRVVERHGGRVWAESVPDGGATFYFSLPLAGPGPD